MERSYGVCRLDIRPSHRRIRSPRIEGYFVGKLGHLSVMEETRYPFSPYVSQQRGLPPNPALNEDAEDGGRDT